jgi:virginiamycin B lyase
MKKLLLLIAAALLPSWSPPVAAQQADFDLKEWDVEWGGRMRDPVVAPDGRVWFVGQAGNYLAVFDPKTEQFFATIPVSGAIRHMVFDPRTKMMWFGTDANKISLSPDGRRIAFLMRKTAAEVWALENFLPAPSEKR